MVAGWQKKSFRRLRLSNPSTKRAANVRKHRHIRADDLRRQGHRARQDERERAGAPSTTLLKHRFLDVAVFRRCEASQNPAGKHCNRDPYYAAKQHGADRSRLEGTSQSNMNAESGKNREGRDGDTG